ncbi:MAG: hypothetical protein ACYTG5_17220 [Planctomycetota bacterium]|jgi:hypothetical protein
MEGYRRLLVLPLLSTLFACGEASEPVILMQEAAPEPLAETLAEPPALELRITPEQAYAAIHVQRAELDLSDADLPAAERVYVEMMFACIDEAIALRVSTLDDFFAGERDFARYSRQHASLLDYIRSLRPPARLRPYHAKIFEAFEAQRNFFSEWSQRGAAFAENRDVFAHPEVKRCSQALHAAYRIINAEIGPKAANQHQAFYSYHCALDFI